MGRKDVNVSIQLTFEEAVFGCKKEISIAIYDECETCHGTGAKAGSHRKLPDLSRDRAGRMMQQSMFGSVTSVEPVPKCGGTGKVVKDPCNTCHGSGKGCVKQKKYELTYQKGIDNEADIRLAGKGKIGETAAATAICS